MALKLGLWALMLTPQELRLWLLLRALGLPYGPEHAVSAAALHVDRRTIERAALGLEKQGLLQVERSHRLANIYTLPDRLPSGWPGPERRTTRQWAELNRLEDLAAALPRYRVVSWPDSRGGDTDVAPSEEEEHPDDPRRVGERGEEHAGLRQHADELQDGGGDQHHRPSVGGASEWNDNGVVPGEPPGATRTVPTVAAEDIAELTAVFEEGHLRCFGTPCDRQSQHYADWGWAVSRYGRFGLRLAIDVLYGDYFKGTYGQEGRAKKSRDHGSLRPELTWMWDDLVHKGWRSLAIGEVADPDDAPLGTLRAEPQPPR